MADGRDGRALREVLIALLVLLTSMAVIAAWVAFFLAMTWLANV